MNTNISPAKVITPPAIEPVTLDEIKLQLGIKTADTQSDAIITRRIKAARRYAEEYTQRALISQVLEIRLDAFPEYIELPRPPVIAVISIKYIDATGAEQTLAPTEYVLDTYSMAGAITPAYGKSWPVVRDERNAVRVQYSAGYGALASDVEPDIREAILLTVGHWMNFQPAIESGNTLTRIPFAVRDKLDQFRMYRL